MRLHDVLSIRLQCFLICFGVTMSTDSIQTEYQSMYPYIARIIHPRNFNCSGVLFKRNIVLTINYCTQFSVPDYRIAPYRSQTVLNPLAEKKLIGVEKIIDCEHQINDRSSRDVLSIMVLNYNDSSSTGIRLDMTLTKNLDIKHIRLIGWSSYDLWLPFQNYYNSDSELWHYPDESKFSYGVNADFNRTCFFFPGSAHVYSHKGNPVLAGLLLNSPCSCDNRMPHFVAIEPHWLWIIKIVDENHVAKSLRALPEN